MRTNPGNRGPHPENPVDDIPHYFQYHLENPGADVLIAALRPSLQAASGAGGEWVEPTDPTQMEDGNLSTEMREDAG